MHLFCGEVNIKTPHLLIVKIYITIILLTYLPLQVIKIYLKFIKIIFTQSEKAFGNAGTISILIKWYA